MAPGRHGKEKKNGQKMKILCVFTRSQKLVTLGGGSYCADKLFRFSEDVIILVEKRIVWCSTWKTEENHVKTRRHQGRHLIAKIGNTRRWVVLCGQVIQIWWRHLHCTGKMIIKKWHLNATEKRRKTGQNREDTEIFTWSYFLVTLGGGSYCADKLFRFSEDVVVLS